MRQPGAFALGRSVALVAAMRLVEALAEAPDPLLIEGERGTGKTALAAHIHGLSRHGRPFIHRPLPALADTLQQDALFGHARGAFTGALHDSRGLIEEAHTGTLFLDELADATPALQATLLDVLERGSITRLGEVKERHVSVRLIAATNADLEQRVEGGTFRQDLLDRFGPFRIRLPPLRERRDEILPLFLANVAQASGETGAGRPDPRESVELDADVASLLLAAPWPGNVRQLRQEARFAACLLGTNAVVRVEHLSTALQAEGEAALGGCRPATARRRAERRSTLRAVLAQEDGDLAAAASRLQMGKRQAFRTLAEPHTGEASRPRGRPRKLM